eukprot:gene15351-32499_t
MNLYFEAYTDHSPCDRVDHCMLTIMRLAFFDSAGLNFVRALMDKSEKQYLVILLIFYVCMTSFILLNGLIGIFGDIFSQNSEQKLKSTSSNNKEKDNNSKQSNNDIISNRNETNTLIQKLQENSERSNLEILSTLKKLSDDVIYVSQNKSKRNTHTSDSNPNFNSRTQSANTRTTIFVD